jgi:hypothetical protein
MQVVKENQHVLTSTELRWFPTIETVKPAQSSPLNYLSPKSLKQNQPSQTSGIRPGLKNQPKPVETVNEQADFQPLACAAAATTSSAPPQKKPSLEKMGKGKEQKALDILAGSDSDGGGEDLSKIHINEEYARRFEHNKRRELLQRHEERMKRGLVADSDSDDDEESSEEDEDSMASRRVDRRVFEVIRRIRSGDPRILDKDTKVYSSSEDEEDEGKPKQGKARKEKPLYLKDVNARHLLEEGPDFVEQPTRSSKYDRIAYDEQQKKGLQAFLDAQKEVIGDEDDFFHEKPKGAAGDQDEEDDEEEKQTKELAGDFRQG